MPASSRAFSEHCFEPSDLPSAPPPLARSSPLASDWAQGRPLQFRPLAQLAAGAQLTELCAGGYRLASTGLESLNDGAESLPSFSKGRTLLMALLVTPFPWWPLALGSTLSSRRRHRWSSSRLARRSRLASPGSWNHRDESRHGLCGHPLALPASRPRGHSPRGTHRHGLFRPAAQLCRAGPPVSSPRPPGQEALQARHGGSSLHALHRTRHSGTDGRPCQCFCRSAHSPRPQRQDPDCRSPHCRWRTASPCCLRFQRFSSGFPGDAGGLGQRLPGGLGRALSLLDKGVCRLAEGLGEVGRLGFWPYAQAAVWACLAHLFVFLGIVLACQAMGIEPYLPGILLSYCAATAAVVALIAFPGSQLGWDLSSLPF